MPDPSQLEQLRKELAEALPDKLAGQLAGPRMKATRKPWAECGLQEQVERLHAELLGLRAEIRRLAQTVYPLESDFGEHFHHAEGGVALPFKRKTGLGMSGPDREDPLA